VLSRDITEHLRVSSLLHRLSAAVQQSPVPMIITDASGMIEYVNPAFCTNSQYAASEVLGQKPRIVRGGGTAAEEYAQLWRTIRSGETWRGMFHNKRKDGSLHWEEAIITPLRDGEGNITQFVAFQQDISARKAAEERVDFWPITTPDRFAEPSLARTGGTGHSPGFTGPKQGGAAVPRRGRL
jgi:PAS domain S-box-containing protein